MGRRSRAARWRRLQAAAPQPAEWSAASRPGEPRVSLAHIRRQTHASEAAGARARRAGTRSGHAGAPGAGRERARPPRRRPTAPGCGARGFRPLLGFGLFLGSLQVYSARGDAKARPGPWLPEASLGRRPRVAAARPRTCRGGVAGICWFPVRKGRPKPEEVQGEAGGMEPGHLSGRSRAGGVRLGCIPPPYPADPSVSQNEPSSWPQRMDNARFFVPLDGDRGRS